MLPRATATRALALCAALLVLYLATLSANHTEAEDAVHYVADATRGERLLHPNHLLFSVLGHAFFTLWRGFGYAGNAFLPMQVLDAVAGASTVGLLYAIGAALRWPPRLALLVALGTGCSYAYWWYSVEAETYVLPLPLTLAAFGYLFRAVQAQGRGAALPRPARLAAVVAVLVATAVLLHQQYVLYFVPLALGLAFAYLGSARAQLTALCVLAATGGGLIGIAYAVAAHVAVGARSPGDVVAWSLGLAAHGVWTPWSLSSIFKGGVGITRALVGLHFLFGFDDFCALVARAFPKQILVEERYLAGQIGPVSRWLALALLIVWMVALVVLVASMGRSWVRHGRSGSAVRPERSDPGISVVFRVGVAAFGIQALFALVWEPQNVEFWITTLPWGFLLVGECIARAPGAGAAPVAAFAVAVGSLALSNLLGSVLPQTRASGDYWYQANATALSVLREGDLFVTEGGYISNGYIGLYTPAKLLRTGPLPAERVAALIMGHEGRVVLSSWAADPPAAVRQSGQLKRWDQAGMRALMTELSPRLREIARDQYQTLWQLQGGAARASP